MVQIVLLWIFGVPIRRQILERQIRSRRLILVLEMVGRGTSPMTFGVGVEQYLLGAILVTKYRPLRLMVPSTDRQTYQMSHLWIGRC